MTRFRLADRPLGRCAGLLAAVAIPAGLFAVGPRECRAQAPAAGKAPAAGAAKAPVPAPAPATPPVNSATNPAARKLPPPQNVGLRATADGVQLSATFYPSPLE